MAAKLKICGLMRAADVALCCGLGVEVLGFVTEYPLPVPWNLGREEVRVLLAGARPPAKTCLVTGGTVDQVAGLAVDLRPGYVHLHYKETLADTAEIAAALTPYGIGVIQTIPPDPAVRLARLGTEDPARWARRLEGAGVAALLVDSRTPDNALGIGRAADLSLYRRVREAARGPVILAGGVTPENCGAVLKAAGPDWLDVMTGVETAPGRKDPEKLKALTAAVRAEK